MSLLDYQAIRQQIGIRPVLELLDYQPTTLRGHQGRGRCLLSSHAGHADDQRCFCVHLQRHLFYCFVCQRGGNQLDLWSAVRNLPLHAATLDLCQHLGIQPITLIDPQPPNLA